MKLKIQGRSAEKKKNAKRLRRNGQIPAIIYGHNVPGETISVSNAEFKSLLAHVKQGHLPTTVFYLTGEDGKERRAIIKEIQYHPTTYEVIHIDFEELKESVPINVKVPIELTSVMECAGVREGGIPRQVIRHAQVRCLPKDLPTHFELDIKELKMQDYKKLADITIPKEVKPLVELDEVVVVIVKR